MPGVVAETELTRKEVIAELPTMSKISGLLAPVESITLFITPLRNSAAADFFIDETTTVQEAHVKAGGLVAYIAKVLSLIHI